MSQGYSYVPPTLDEAIKAYQRAKEKAKLVENYARDRVRQPNLSLESKHGKQRDRLPTEPIIRPRRRVYSQGSITELNNSDDADTGEEDNRRRRLQNVHKVRRRRDAPRNHHAVVANYSLPAWPQGYPANSFYQYNPIMPHYPNMHAPPALPSLQGYYMNSMVPNPYFYPHPPPPHAAAPNFVHNNLQHQPFTTQYNGQPVEPMNHRDFQRDCKYSPAPSRPYSDSDLLETLSTRAVRDSERFSVVPPIKKMDRLTAATVIQQRYRGYQKKKKSGVIREQFYIDFVDMLIDDVLVEELLPDLLVEVLLYGVRDIKLPSVTERVVQEYSEQILDECVYDMLRTTTNSVLSEILSVYSGHKAERQETDMIMYVVDELISLQIRDVVQEFLQEYISEFQCERVYNQLVYETISILVYEVVKDETPEEEALPKKGKAAFDLDDIILASVLCRSLVPNEDYVLDGIIAQGIANHLKIENDKSS